MCKRPFPIPISIQAVKRLICLMLAFVLSAGIYTSASACTVRPVPHDVTVTKNSISSSRRYLSFEWENDKKAAKYVVEIASDPEFTKNRRTTTVTSTNARFIIQGYMSSMFCPDVYISYYMRVKAVYWDRHESEWSASVYCPCP